jgi:predicted transcriptional regulator YdeE
MCRWCEGVAVGLEGFAIERREDARLAGIVWQGSHAEAVAGGLAGALARLRERILEEQAFAPGPLVAVTLAGQGDEVRCFAGGRLAEGAAAPAGLEEFAVAASDYAVANHHRADGEVLDRYAAMLDWIRAERLSRDRSHWQHREEYPLHADFARPEAVRLMVPVKAAG